MLKSFRELRVWNEAMALAKDVYALVRSFPETERFGIVSQLTRAAVSVPSNIAEGYGRGSKKDYVRFLYQAQGSLYEVETQIELAKQLGYCSSVAGIFEQIETTSKMLGAMIRKLETQAEGKRK